jgi:hypothetical protein
MEKVMKNIVIEASCDVINGLPHIKDVRPICDEDAALLKDIRAVLEKHGALNRFGLQLLHKHYDLNDGEILLEATNEESRIIEIKPTPKADINKIGQDESIIYTAVMFNKETAASGIITLACVASCLSHGFGKVHRSW